MGIIATPLGVDELPLHSFNGKEGIFQQPSLDLTSTVSGKDERKFEIYRKKFFGLIVNPNV